MNLKKMLVATAAIATATMLHTAPAHAAFPSCASYSTLPPRREALSGPDLVKANYAMSNWCNQSFVVHLTMYADIDCDEQVQDICFYQPIQKNAYPVSAQSDNGFEISAGCVQGTHRYYMEWSLTDANGAVLAEGETEESLLACENRPPTPNVDAYCQKVPEPCKIIHP